MESRASMLKAIGLGISGATVLASTGAAYAADVPAMGLKLSPLVLSPSVRPVSPSQELKIFVITGKGGANAIALPASDSAGISKLSTEYKVTPATLFKSGGLLHIGLGGAAASKSRSQISEDASAINFAGATRAVGPMTAGG